MKISEHIGNTLENWSEAWKDRLRGWMASWLGFGIEVFFDVLGKAFAPKLKPFIDKMEESGEVPPELQPLLDELKNPTGEAAGMLGSAAGYSIIGGAIGKVIDAIFNPLGYWAYRWRPNLMPDLNQLLSLWLRGHVKDEDMPYFISSQGFKEEMAPMFEDLAQIRLDPATITAVWLRDKAQYEKFWQDLKHQGWTEDRIAVAKELAHIIPPLPDMVRFADFGAFDPEVIEAWRDFYDAPGWILEPMSKIGITGEWANKYWFSHWRQPGRFELGEMHRRGLIDDDIVKMAYLTQGFSTFWQDKLLELVKEPWTRVDIRRMWDMRTISEEELRKAYRAVGYYDEWLEGMVLWTKVYVAFPDLVARWKNGWITEADVRSELTALGMPAERVDEMIQTKIKPAQPERTAKERDLTKSEIVKGVKKEYITWDEGVDLLTDMGYDPTESDFILSISIAVEAGSPETFPEFKELTQKWRRSVGKEAAPVPEELKAAANELVRITKEIEDLKRAITEEERTLVGEEILPKEATERLDKLRVILHRAEASLAQARSRYDQQVAIFRHAPPGS